MHGDFQKCFEKVVQALAEEKLLKDGIVKGTTVKPRFKVCLGDKLFVP
jgi:hypothetical protein